MVCVVRDGRQVRTPVRRIPRRLSRRSRRPRCPLTPTEGVPVAWAVVDRHGVLLPNSNEAAEVACFRTKDEADEELAYANQGEGAP